MANFQQLDIILTEQGDNKVSLRYLVDKDRLLFDDRLLDKADLKAEIREAEKNYYAYIPGNLLDTGKALYNWLDGEDHFLERAIGEFAADQLLVLAFQGTGTLLHLPWELMHNGQEYLVQQMRRDIVPVRLEPEKTTPRVPQKRALEMVFMATSPRDVQPRLDFEVEEVRILEAIEKLPINLEVEESGNLEELHYLLNQMGETSVDVVHISGHAANQPEPHFLTEDTHGNLQKATSKDFGECFSNHKPSLLFLSGCQTGGATQQGGIPSLAEDLVQTGFPAVLAWAKPVLDRTATEAASHIYRVLSEGQSLPKALHTAFNALLNDKDQRFSDWHLLRLYALGNVPGNLIQPGRYRKRIPASEKQFLDSDRKVKVPGRRGFVGRRRVLQDCLKVVRDPKAEYSGIVLHGTGGLGKSSLASRLCQRLEYFYECKVLVGVLDELVLLGKLGFDQTKVIESLKARFRFVFENRNSDKRLLIVLDDFEQNFEQEHGRPKDFGKGEFRLTVNAVNVLKSLLQAIHEYTIDDQAPQILITSRYTFELKGTGGTPGTSLLKFIQLNSFEDGAWERFKKRQKTTGFDKKLVQQCEQVADGNPRLLEWLLEVIEQAKGLDTAKLLDQLVAKEEAFREDVLAQFLYDSQNKKTQELIKCLALFEVPVPLTVLEDYTGISSVKDLLQSASNISLVEQYDEFFGEADAHYRLAEVFKKLTGSRSKDEYKLAAWALVNVQNGSLVETMMAEIIRLAINGRVSEILKTVSVLHLAHLYRSDRFREAVALSKQIQNVTNDIPELCLWKGRSLKAMGFWEECMEEFNHALEMSPSTDTESLILINKSYVQYHRGEIADAITSLNQADLILQKEDLDENRSNVLHLKASWTFQQGNPQKALKLLDEVIAIRKMNGKEMDIGPPLHEKGKIYHHLGQLDLALGYYEASLKLHEKTQNIKGVASNLHGIGHVLAIRGKGEEAIVMFEKSLDYSRKINDFKAIADTNSRMAYVYRTKGQYDIAAELYQKAHDFSLKIGYIKGQADNLNELGIAELKMGFKKKALNHFERSLELSEQIDDKAGISASILAIANLKLNSNSLSTVRELYQRAFSLAVESEDKHGQANIQIMISQVEASQGNFRLAWSQIKQSLLILREISPIDFETANAIALQIICGLINQELGTDAVHSFMEKMEKNQATAHAWLKKQGIDISLEAPPDKDDE